LNSTQLQSACAPSEQLNDTSSTTFQTPDAVDVFNRPLNEFSFELSENDSFKTCASTINSSSISKQMKQSESRQQQQQQQQRLDEHQSSPDERILLIRERERGVSLPVTMKIDYDDMALRLSTSTPIEAPFYSEIDVDMPTSSMSNEPMPKTASSSRASTPSLNSNENELQQQMHPSSSSWLNTINTITTTTEGPDGRKLHIFVIVDIYIVVIERTIIERVHRT
jgi:hypothetical protein